MVGVYIHEILPKNAFKLVGTVLKCKFRVANVLQNCRDNMVVKQCLLVILDHVGCYKRRCQVLSSKQRERSWECGLLEIGCFEELVKNEMM